MLSPGVQLRANPFRMFKNQGIGVGLKPEYYDHFLSGPPSSVQWVEVISENFLRWKNGILASEPIQTLEKIRSHLPVRMHGVSMSIGSTDPLCPDYFRNLKEIVGRIQPEIVSDHLCWIGVDGQNLHDLLPLPYTEETVKWVSNRILQAQDMLGRRLVFENLSSYVEFEQSEMTEWEFVSEIAKRADCGLLLDINNVYVSGSNHKFNPLDYLKNVPHERVAQIHLAGHSVKPDGFLIDTHSHPVCDDVWKLYQWYIQKYGVQSTMVERDGNLPEWQELEAELIHIKKIQDVVNAREQSPAVAATI